MANIPTWNQALPDPGFYTQDALRKAQEYQTRQQARLNEQDAAIKQAEHESKSRIIPLDMIEGNFADNVFYGDKDKAKWATDQARQLGFVRGEGQMAGMSGYDLEAFKKGMMAKKDIAGEFARNRYDSAKRALIEMEQEAKQLVQPIPGQGDATNTKDIIKRQKDIADLQLRIQKAKQDAEGALRGWASADPENATKYSKLYETGVKEVGGNTWMDPKMGLLGGVLGNEPRNLGVTPIGQAALNKAGEVKHVDAVTQKVIDQSKAVNTGTFAKSLVQNAEISASLGLNAKQVEDIDTRLNGIIKLALDPEKAMLATEQLRALLGAYPQLAPLQNIIDEAEAYAQARSRVTGGVGAAADFTQAFRVGVNKWKATIPGAKSAISEDQIPDRDPSLAPVGGAPSPQAQKPAQAPPAKAAVPAATPVPPTAAQFTAGGKKLRTLATDNTAPVTTPTATDNAIAPVSDNAVRAAITATPPPKPDVKPKTSETREKGKPYKDDALDVWVTADRKKYYDPAYGWVELTASKEKELRYIVESNQTFNNLGKWGMHNIRKAFQYGAVK